MAHHSVWGPSGLIVEQVVRRAATLTDDERTKLQEAWEAEPEDRDYDEAWGKAEAAAFIDGRELTRPVAAARAASGYSSATPVRFAVAAAAVSDLVGSWGLTTEHVDTLLGPWLQVVGDPRVDPVCECGTPPVTIAAGVLAPQPGDRFPWLVMAVDDPEPLILGYAETLADALRLADKIDGPAILWRAGKETP